jgi:hypothetical protein
MKSSWETYHGKRIMFARYDHLSAQDLRTEISCVVKEVIQQPAGSVLMIIDVTGTIISPEVLNLFKNVAVETKSYAGKIAVLGITGARRTMMDMVVKFSGIHLEAMDSAQQAREWLVK